MAYTFGALNTDDVSIASHLNSNGGGHCVFGWWYPTTLTAGNIYWGASSLTKIAVGPTTSELRIHIDRATTDAVWDSSGAGIAVNNWYFIATVRSSNAGDQNMRLWIGTEANHPLEVSISASTAGAGAETASSTASVGNASTSATTAFIGDIEQVLDMRWANSVAAPLANETPATITQAESDYFYQTCVVPYWLGDPQPTWVRGTNTAGYVFDLSGSGPQLDIHQRGTTQRLTPEALTVNGATYSNRRAPRPILQSWPPKLQFINRR